MIGRRGASNGHGREPLLGILDRDTTYDGRLERVLEFVSEMTSLSNVYVYVAHAGGGHLHLARSRVTAVATPSDGGAPVLGTVDEGGTAWNVGTPPFELTRREVGDAVRVVDSPVGPLLSLPLQTAGGTLVGAVHAGPVEGTKPPKAAAARHAELGTVIAAVLSATVREEATRRRAETAELQLEAARRIAGGALDVEKLVSLLLDLALPATHSETGFVAIADRHGALRIAGQRGLDQSVLDAISLDPDAGLFDWSLSEADGGLILRDVETATELGIRSVLAVPLTERGERLGIFALLNFGDAGTFGEHSLELLDAFAEQIRLMLHNARTFGDFSERYLQTMIGLARSMNAGEGAGSDHHERVSSVCRVLATGLGMDAAEVDAIVIAGLIHDVGMVAAAEQAFDADIQHPAVGASLIEHLPLHRSVARAVASHHEWFDGWGFPQGLEGRAIPRAGRVLAMAEFLVEMSTPDLVRPAWSAAQLTAEVRQRRGTQFDPEIADLTVALIESRDAELLAAGIGLDRPTTED